MKILSITTQKPHSTGSGIYLTELVRSLDRMKHEQAVVAGVYISDSVSFPEGVDFYPVFYTEPGKGSKNGVVKEPENEPGNAPMNAPESDIPFPILGMSDVMPYPSTRYSDLTDGDIETLEKHFITVISEAVRNLDPDVIICHHLYLLTAMVRKHFPDRRVAGISHGSDLRQIRNCGSHRAEIREYIRKLDLICALHGHQRDDICDIFNVPEDDVFILGSGYNPEIFNAGEGKVAVTRSEAEGDPIRLMYAGKICGEKGLAPLFDALSEIAADHAVTPFRLRLAGGCNDSELSKRIWRSEAEACTIGEVEGLPFRAEYLGMLRQSDLADELRESDVFILPSYYEGLPLVLVEAMACGAIPVCTDLPGIRPWIESRIGSDEVIFVKPPRMEKPGKPFEGDLPAFSEDLKKAVLSAFDRVKDDRLRGFRELPGTSEISWDSVAETLVDFCNFI